MSGARVVVVGGGVVGLAAALEFARRGAQTLVLECARRGRSSPAGAGILSPLPPWRAPAAVAAWAAAGARAYPQWLAAVGAPRSLMRRVGMVVLPDTENDGGAAWAREKTAFEKWRGANPDSEARLVEGEELARISPGIAAGFNAAFFLPRVSRVPPRRLLGFLRRKLRAAGGAIVADAVSGWRERRGRIAAARGARADYAGDAFALCAGAWSGALCPPPPPRIEPARGFLLGLRTTAKIDFSPSPTVVLQGGRYVFARRGGDGEMRYAVGGGFARAGFSTARADDEIESLAAAAAQMIPSLRGARNRMDAARLSPAAGAVRVAAGRASSAPRQFVFALRAFSLWADDGAGDGGGVGANRRRDRVVGGARARRKRMTARREEKAAPVKVAPVVAIDGPAAAGKGTVARAAAALLGFHYLDSGRVYRALALLARERGSDDGDAATPPIADLARAIAADEGLFARLCAAPDIGGEEIGARASRIASWPEVRELLRPLQRARRLPPGLVADGRDMSLVFPDAAVKIYLDADLETRARRRFLQLRGGGKNVKMEEVRQAMSKRDDFDKNRAIAPLAQRDDLTRIDATHRGATEIARHIAALVDAATNKPNQARSMKTE